MSDPLQDKYRGQVNAGSEAENILTSKIYRDARDSIRNRLLKDFMETTIEQSDDSFRLRVQVALQWIAEVERFFEIVVRDGAKAADELKFLDGDETRGIL